VGAVLVRTDFERANLEGVDFEGANLQNANLLDAKLDLANFRMCNLKGTRYQGGAGHLQVPTLDRRVQFQALPSVGFSGSIASVRLSDLLQLLCLAQANLVLSIEGPETRGTVHVRSGRLCHAQVDQFEGEEALYKMLHWETGHFDTQSLPEIETHTIEKPVEYLLIEAMRYRDEKGKEHRDAAEIVSEIRSHAPIPVLPAHELNVLLAKEGMESGANAQELRITDAFDSGEAGILCSVSIGEKVMIAPLWHLEFSPEHPLYNRVIEYQIEHR
jgi:hypothetical protein